MDSGLMIFEMVPMCIVRKIPERNRKGFLCSGLQRVHSTVAWAERPAGSMSSKRLFVLVRKQTKRDLGTRVMPPEVSRTSQNYTIGWGPNAQHKTQWRISDSCRNTLWSKMLYAIEEKNHGWQWELSTGYPVTLEKNTQADFVLSTQTDRVRPSLQSTHNILCLRTNNTIRFLNTLGKFLPVLNRKQMVLLVPLS